MITYKHEAFIKEAIEGVLMQEVSFPVELIISDDCSPDNTEEVVRNIQKNHKNGHWIKYTKHQNNKGMMPNFIWALSECKHKYIALCEGDDYWTDPLKLQKQVDFLEENEDCAFCFHKVQELENGKLYDDSIKRPNKKRFEFEEILEKNYAHTPSVVFRNDFDFSKLPKWFYHAIPGDHTLQILLTSKRRYAFMLDDVMAVYRRHGGGIWSSDGGKKYTLQRATTRIHLYNYLKIIDDKIRVKPYYMLADYVSENGYKKISRKEYLHLLKMYFSCKSKVKVPYLFYPKMVSKLKNKKYSF